MTLLLVGGVASKPAAAQGGPPLLTDDPGTPGDGVWEINIALTIEQIRKQRVYEAPLLDLNYGYGQNVQLKFEVPWLLLENSPDSLRSGLGNPKVGVKWRFLEEDSAGAAVSVYPQFAFSNSCAVDRGLTEEGFELLIPLQIAKNLGPLSANLEVGYAAFHHTEDVWVYGVALGREFPRFELIGEIRGAALRDLSGSELVFTVGSRTDLTRFLTLLASVGRSLRGSEEGGPDLLAYIGMQFIF